MLSAYKLALPALSPENTPQASVPLLKHAQDCFGFIPNMFGLMAHAPGLLSTYQHGYAQFRNDSGFTAVEQELVFLAISIEHGCEYCVSAHSMVARVLSKMPAEVLSALREQAPLADVKLAALAGFTRQMVQTRGLPDRAQVDAFLSAGYSERQILELILAIAIKTISNYSNHLLHTPLDAAFAGHRWQKNLPGA